MNFSVWKICLALIPAAGICLADLLEEEAIRRTINTDGLVYFWPMEGDGSAKIGGVNLTSTNGVLYGEQRFGWQAAQCQSSKWFRTSGDIVLSNEFTISAWVRPNLGSGFGSSELGMICAGIATTQGYFRLQTNNVSLANDGESKLVVSTNAVPQNVWHHVVVTCTATQQVIYLNGSRRNAASVAMPFVIRINSVGTGYRTAAENGERYSLRALLDDLRFYNRALSSGEVFRIYSEVWP